MQYDNVIFYVILNRLKGRNTVNNKYHKVDLPGFATKKTELIAQWFNVLCLIAFISIPAKSAEQIH
jgi:hypothetical protein